MDATTVAVRCAKLANTWRYADNARLEMPPAWSRSKQQQKKTNKHSCSHHFSSGQKVNLISKVFADIFPHFNIVASFIPIFTFLKLIWLLKHVAVYKNIIPDLKQSSVPVLSIYKVNNNHKLKKSLNTIQKC